MKKNSFLQENARSDAEGATNRLITLLIVFQTVSKSKGLVTIAVKLVSMEENANAKEQT